MAFAAIEFQEVTKTYGQIAALMNVSFEVDPGDVCAFLGPNGAGKTTSISILMGFLFADSGTIRVLGYPPGDIRAKEQIGFLPENFAFHKHLTAEQLLRLHLVLSRRNTPKAQSALKPTPWTEHLTALAYGLDMALVFFLLAAWSFRKRSLSRL